MRSNAVKVMMGLFVAIVFGIAGCGGGGDGGSAAAPATPATPAETAAAKLATLKQVEGNWMFSYSSPTTTNTVLKLSNVAPISSLTLNPAYDYVVTAASSPAGGIFDSGYVNSTNTWTILDKTWYDRTLEVGFTTKYQFKTDGSKILDGGCVYIVAAANQGPVGNKGATSACYPLSGVKTP